MLRSWTLSCRWWGPGEGFLLKTHVASFVVEVACSDKVRR